MEELFLKAFNNLGYDIKPRIVKSSKADFQCDDCFRLAKETHANPRDIALSVIDELKKDPAFSSTFSDVSVAGPGFINIFVSDKFICDNLNELFDKEILGSTPENETIVIDYGGPNVAKPLHVGHLRTAIIGQAINNILMFKGNKTISDVHLGDIGTQMGQVIYGIIHDFPNTDFKDIDFDLDYLNKTYPRISALCKENEDVRRECLRITKELQEGNSDFRILWKKICDISIKDIKKLYDYLNVHFDLWYGESNAYNEFPEMMEFLMDTGLLKSDDGALIIDVKEDDDKTLIPPCLIRKSDGAYLYATSDLGTIWQRKKDFNPDEIIYVVDARQGMHFTQVFRVCAKTHLFDGKLKHYGYGTVNGPDNRPFKTRDGGTLKLEDLIGLIRKEFTSLRPENKNMPLDDVDKIVNAIIKFADLQNDFERNYIFDIKKFSEVNGKTGPYLLYTYLRINKLLDGSFSKVSCNIYNEADRALKLKLLEVSSVIDLASLERKPHYIANYLYELAVCANNFYQANRFSGIDDNVRKDYISVLTFTNKVLETLLGLLGIQIPRAM